MLFGKEFKTAAEAYLMAREANEKAQLAAQKASEEAKRVEGVLWGVWAGSDGFPETTTVQIGEGGKVLQLDEDMIRVLSPIMVV